MAYIKGDYKSASNNFEQAFGINKQAFAKDLYLAAIVQSNLSQFNLCSKNLISLVLKGFSFESIKKNKNFENYFKSPHAKTIENTLKQEKLALNTQQRKYLRHKVDSLFERDQYYRNLEGGYEKYGNEIRMLDSSNTLYLKKLFNQYGYLGEELIGLDNDTTLINTKLPVILVHQGFGSNNRFFDFTSEYYKAINNGSIDAQTGTFLIDRSSNTPLFNAQDGGIIQLSFKPKKGTNLKPQQTNPGYYLITNEKEIDQFRKEYGLHTLDEMRQIAVYNIKKIGIKIPCGIGSMNISEFNYNDIEDYNYARNNFIELKK